MISGMIMYLKIRFILFNTYKSDVKAEQFVKEPSYSSVINNINTILSTEIPSFREEVSPRMWASIDEEIVIQDCDIYSFIPDPDSDPFEEESTCYLIYNLLI